MKLPLSRASSPMPLLLHLSAPAPEGEVDSGLEAAAVGVAAGAGEPYPPPPLPYAVPPLGCPSRGSRRLLEARMLLILFANLWHGGCKM